MTHDHSATDPTEVAFDAAFWDERYRSADSLWSGKPNPQLVTEAADLAPGAALDVGSGEGADAIWLAERGWQVTAVDISTVALERGAAQAAVVGADVAARITWVQADVTGWTPNPDAYDLVTAQYMHLPSAERERLHRRLAASVAPGGILLVVGHHPSDMQTTVPRPQRPDLFFTGTDVVAALPADEWVVLADDARPRSTLDPDGNTVTIRDAVLKARRQA